MRYVFAKNYFLIQTSTGLRNVGMLCNMRRLLIMLIMICLPALGVVGIIENECDGCCRNYTYNEDNNSCDPCPLGTYGNNCSSTCPHNYYGLFCDQKCDCKNELVCSPVDGCLHPTAMINIQINTSDVYISKDSCWKPQESSCCVNYYFNRENSSCDPCPNGTFGDNCSTSCPPGFYGLFCKRRCNCGIGIYCSPVSGCINWITTTTVETMTNTNMKTMHKYGCWNPLESRCCLNYYFSRDENHCKLCPPGRFGDNCTRSCPPGYYGHFCKHKCECDVEIYCSPVTGCSNLITTTRNAGISDNPSNIVPRNVLIVNFVCSLICVAVSMSICFRVLKRNIFHIPLNSSVQDTRQWGTATNFVYKEETFQNMSTESKVVQDNLKITEGIYDEISSNDIEEI